MFGRLHYIRYFYPIIFHLCDIWHWYQSACILFTLILKRVQYLELLLLSEQKRIHFWLS